MEDQKAKRVKRYKHLFEGQTKVERASIDAEELGES